MENKRCFVICPFSNPGSEVRKRSDFVLEFIVKPSVQDLGYEVDRSDMSAKPGIVTVNVIQHLIEDDLVVADITDRNPNVFYELAIRHAIRRPYVQIMSAGQAIPFNIQEIQTVIYDATDVESIKKAIEMIKKQIIYYEGGGSVTSPVTQAIDSLIGIRSVAEFTELVEKVSDLDKSIAETKKLSQQIEGIRTMIVSVERSVQSISRQPNNETSKKSSNTQGQTAEPSQVEQTGRGMRYTVSEWIDKQQIEKKWK